jgi:23S rRNA (uracil1939-C5)-methyltransferase
MLSPGSELILVPEKPVAGGSMLARHEGRVVLVRGAIPGERIRVRVERLSRDVAHAVVIDIIESNADRRQPSVDPDCGGNAFAHVAYNRQLVLKAEILADAFARLARITLPQPVSVAPSPERGYRMRARFHLRGRRAGFYRERTHELCDAATSGQLQPAAIGAVQTVARALDDPTADAALGIELAENIAGDQRAAHVELRDDRVAARLQASGPVEGLTGLSWSLASDPHTHVVAGSPFVIDGLDVRPLGAPRGSEAVQLRRHVRAFFQGNRYLLSELVERVLACVPAGPITDLYAGVGLFAVALASTRRDEVVAVEGDLISATDLIANAASCARPFVASHLSVEDFLKRSGQLPSHAMIVDPPRTGLSRDAATAIQHHQPRRLVYVSCDVATLARDVKTFTAGGYRLAHIEAFDLFPNTAHIETIAVLDRR